MKKIISYLIDHIQRPEIRYVQRLKRKGFTVGKNFKIQRGAIIDESHCFLISIGNNVTIAPHAYILAHDASTFKYLGYTKIGLVLIGDNVFVGARSIILPNVKIGNDVIIGAGSVITKNIPDNCIVAGNPSVVIGKTDEYISRHRENLKSKPKFSIRWRMSHDIQEDMRSSMVEQLKEGIGYIE